MSNVIKSVPGVLLLIFIVSVVLPHRAEGGIPQIGCGFTIVKEAGGSDQIFNFLVNPSTGADFEVPVTPGTDEGGFGLDVGESAEVSEIVPDGWIFQDVSCGIVGGGISVITDGSNSVFVSCPSPGLGFCTFTNVQTGAIPTLSEWGMIAAAAGLAIVGVFFAVRRKRAQAV